MRSDSLRYQWYTVQYSSASKLLLFLMLAINVVL